MKMNRGDSREPIRVNRFAEKNQSFLTRERFARDIASDLRLAMLSPPKSRFAKKGVRFGNPEVHGDEI